MRCTQFLEGVHPHVHFDAGRVAANAWEILAGLRWWMRQLELHAGFYRFMATHKSSSIGARSPEDAIAHALAGAAPPNGQPAVKLTGIDKIKEAIMKIPGFSFGQERSTGDMRAKLLGKFRGEHELAELVKRACKELSESKLLKEADPDGKRPGRKVGRYTKPSWDEIEGPGEAKAEAVRLQLARTVFD
jgi:hypothetical protein